MTTLQAGMISTFKLSTIGNLPTAPSTSSRQDLQQRILDYQFSVHVLSPGVDDREVLSIFARMNSTGVKLNPQELRNAEYFGDVQDIYV